AVRSVIGQRADPTTVGASELHGGPPRKWHSSEPARQHAQFLVQESSHADAYYQTGPVIASPRCVSSTHVTLTLMQANTLAFPSPSTSRGCPGCEVRARQGGNRPCRIVLG